MMGFGAMSMAPLILGAFAVATIWGGLWWLLSAIGHLGAVAQPKELESTQPLPDQVTTDWQQPSFEHPAPPLAPSPLPTRAKPESDYR